MSQAPLLIVNKTTLQSEETTGLVADLTGKFGLDAFTVRQRLTGQGLGLFASAPLEKLEKVSALLGRHGLGNWIVDPTPPRFSPLRARGLEISGERIAFLAGDQQVVLERGDRVLAILADLTGTLVQRNLKRLMVQTAYLGADAAERLDEDESYKTVLQNHPVLDIYLLDDQHAIRQGVRLFAGRYDPNGLGDRKSYSAAGNIDAIVQLVREYAGSFYLRTDFGLSELPGCRMKRLEADQNPDKTHLTPLTRFGWLIADVLGRQEAAAAAPSPTLAVAAAVIGGPAAAVIATAAGEAVPGMEELAAELQDAPESKADEKTAKSRPLPPPPDLKPMGRRHLIRQLLAFGGIVLGGGLTVLSPLAEILEPMARFGLRTGTAPAAFSVLFGWMGLRRLGIKRHIQNLPTSKIRSVAMGMVEVQGHVRRKYALVSPMTHQPCVFYSLRKFRRDDESHNWKEYSSTDCGPIPFDVEDRTGRLTVDPAGAEIKSNHRQEGGPGQGSLLFAAAGLHDANEKWVEEVIPEGSFVYVTGFAGSESRAGSSLRERTLAALRELKQNRHLMNRYDADGDGRISEEEWQQAREDVEQQVLRQSLEEQQEAAPQAGVVIGRPGQRGLPFIIAETESETHLARSYAISSVVLLVLGFSLGIFALVRLVSFFGGRG